MNIPQVLVIAGLGLCLVSTRGFSQGSLTPPGTPAPTMKTLAQVEPRTPISSDQFTITSPGSYYLTCNLTSSWTCIGITASGVTLDLMGYSLTGNRDGSYCGISLGGPLHDVVVRNGTIQAFGQGIQCSGAVNVRLENLVVSSNLYYGIYLSGESGNRCDGNTVSDCIMRDNGSGGCFLCGSWGFCNGNKLVNCTVSGNGGGMAAGIHLDGNQGQCGGNVVLNCVIFGNNNRGIWAEYASGNRIEGNHVTGQAGSSTGGIRTEGSCSNNLVLRNSCVGNTLNYSLSSIDTYGPIVTNSGELATSGAAAHPWANFSR